MSDDYGQKIGRAFKAILLLYSDISRLFRELDDREFSGWKSVFGSVVTKGMTKDFKQYHWMPKTVFRCYRREEQVGLIEGVTVCLLSEEKEVPVPVLITSQVQYAVANGSEHDATNGTCGTCTLTRTMCRAMESSKFLGEASMGELNGAKLIAVPVYSITSRQAVTELINRTRSRLGEVKRCRKR